MIRERPFKDKDETMVEEGTDKLKTDGHGDILGHEEELMQEKNDVFSMDIGVGLRYRRPIPLRGVEGGEETVEEILVGLDVLDDVGLIVEDEGI